MANFQQPLGGTEDDFNSPKAQKCDEQKVIAKVQNSIERAMQDLKLQHDQAQVNVVQDVFMSDNFKQIREKFFTTIQEKRQESEDGMNKLCQEMEGLVRFVKLNRKEFKKESEQILEEQKSSMGGRNNRESCDANAKQRGVEAQLDITEDMHNLFIRFDVQRRFFNILSMEILAM